MPKLIVKLGEKKEFSFDKPLIHIGRALDNDLVIENLSVSRRHAQIEDENGRFYVTDLGSANGTFVNGNRVQKQLLKDQDEISVGKVKLFFIDDIKAEAEPMPLSPFDFDKTFVIPKTTPCFFTLLGTTEDNYRIDKPEAFIGRESNCDIVVQDWLASKKHARINIIGNNCMLTDLGSLAGTKVNGQKIKDKLLTNNDMIEIGFTKIRFRTSLESSIDIPSPQIQPSIENVHSKSEEPKTVRVKQDVASPVPVAAGRGKLVASILSPVFHKADCIWANGIKEQNRIYFESVEDAIKSRHHSCGTCQPGRDAKYLSSWKEMTQDEDETVAEHAMKMLEFIKSR